MIETHYIYIHYCNWGYPESCTPEPGHSHRGCYGLCEAACHGAGGVLAFFHLSNWLKPSEFIILKLLGNESWKMFFQDVHHWLLILEWQINIFNRLYIYITYIEWQMCSGKFWSKKSQFFTKDSSTDPRPKQLGRAVTMPRRRPMRSIQSLGVPTWLSWSSVVWSVMCMQ